jgi:hypothetical protein
MPRGRRLRVPGSLDALPVGERAPVRGDGVGVEARGQEGGGELVPRAQRVGMLRAADPRGIGERALEDGDRAPELASRHKGVTEAEPRCDQIVVIRLELHGQGVEQPLRPAGGVARASGSQEGLGQSLPSHYRVWMGSTEQPVAGGEQVAPMIHRRTGQAGMVQAVPGPEQHRMASPGPQPVSGDLPQGRSARAQAGCGPVGRLCFWPGLEQRVRGHPGRLIQQAFRHHRPQRCLQHRADPNRRRCRGGCDGQQAHAFQRRQRFVRGLAACPGPAASGHIASSPVASSPADCCRGGQHRCGYAVPV